MVRRLTFGSYRCRADLSSATTLAPMPAADPLARARTLTVADARPLARDVVGFDLVDPAGAPLPAFRAGAHVALETPAGLVRRYSLVNDPAETHRYVIAVKREAGEPRRLGEHGRAAQGGRHDPRVDAAQRSSRWTRRRRASSSSPAASASRRSSP